MANNARTPSDLERKYNFAALLGLSKNVKMNEKSITKVENELANMLNTLIINLKDVIDSQSEVSLWFYSGTPTTSNAPYINWNTPSEHYGDIYYDQKTGYVYQYSANGWTKNTDMNLVQAMALTNVELDTTTDHERKVYFSQPVPPYSSGDWWILEDGTLKICQIGKTSGSYETNDFIVSSKYVATVATKTGDTLTVLEGTVTEITKNYVKYTDLATGGSTIINGSNITTGNINTDNISIGNDNVKLDKEGLKLKNGAKVVGDNGLMNTYIYNAEGIVGYTRDFLYNSATGDYDHINTTDLLFSLIIPEGLQITSAKIQLVHSAVTWLPGDIDSNITQATEGRCQNVKISKATNVYNRQLSATVNSEIWFNDDFTEYQEISGALGSSGWTPSSSAASESTISIDIKDSLKNSDNTYSGLKQLKVHVPEPVQTWSDADIALQTGYIFGILKIDGYMTYN